MTWGSSSSLQREEERFIDAFCSCYMFPSPFKPCLFAGLWQEGWWDGGQDTEPPARLCCAASTTWGVCRPYSPVEDLWTSAGKGGASVWVCCYTIHCKCAPEAWQEVCNSPSDCLHSSLTHMLYGCHIEVLQVSVLFCLNSSFLL